MPDEQKKKNELINLIKQSKEKGEKIVAKSGEVAQFGQYTIDLADSSNRVLQYIEPSKVDWNPRISAWEYLNNRQDEILRGMGVTIPMTASANTVSYSMTEFASAINVFPYIPLEKRDEVSFDVQRLSNVIGRQTEKDNILNSLNKYGFKSTANNQESPIALFSTAWATFERPVIKKPSVAASLIPMRECINMVIADLLRRRPRQETTKSGRKKISSILNQLAADGIPQSARNSLADRWKVLADELSSAKQRRCSREQWEQLLRKSTLFLREFLESLDLSKMK